MVSVNHTDTDTIAALATPPGRGGIAVVRVSGPGVKHIIDLMLGQQLDSRKACLLPFKDQTGQTIDEGIAIYFPNPHSFTGEDVLELHGHGGPVVVDLLLQTLLAMGVRMAKPGEFSERAFLNGKLDLAQAEAVADLINASSRQAAQSAMRSLQGEFSRAVHALNEKIIHLRMYVEAAIDFSDEEIDFLADDKISQTAKQIVADLQSIQNNAKQGSMLREGIRVVIVGEPNVGKSSLLNALSGKELAIVTDIPGTTRDVLRDEILIDGMPMHVIDTAGLRDSDDVVEQEGIKRAWREVESADLVLFLTDHQRPFKENHQFNDKPVVYVKNKADLFKDQHEEIDQHPVICISAKTGDGLLELKQEIKSQVGYQGDSDDVFLARRRHLDALLRATQHVQAALDQLSQHHAGELAAEDLRQAHLALSEITGEFTSDDLLGRIFSSFCIGK